MLKYCVQCGIEFNAHTIATKYCSRKCYQDSRNQQVLCQCVFCKKSFYEKQCRVADGRGKYCSKRCQNEHQKTKFLGKNNPHYTTGLIEKICLMCGKKFYVKNKNKNTSKYCSVLCKVKYTDKGITPLRVKMRSSTEQKQWVLNVFKRDHFTCQICGDNTGGNLEAHHIKLFSLYPEERLNLDNGVTLCTGCHLALHSIINTIKFISH